MNPLGYRLPEKWQLETIYEYISIVPMGEVEWLLGYYGDQSQVDFWTANYNRANEVIDRLEGSIP